MHLDKDFIDRLNRLGSSGVPFLFIIDFEERQPLVYPLDRLPGNIRFSIAGAREEPVHPGPVPTFVFSGDPIPFERYRKSFEVVMKHLQRGNSYLVNLTFATPVDTGLTMEEIFEFSRAPYRLLIQDRFVVFSPEPFITIKEGIIRSFPMKGTIDGSLADAEKTLLGNRKETAEHCTIVDLIRNDLSKVSKDVSVDRFRYIDRLSVHGREILQVSSEITGQMPGNYPEKIGDILNALLPAGSVSGAPKEKTLDIIREAEDGPRGYYTGIFGTFDGLNLHSAVMIRFLEKTGSGLVYRSGGGITHLSEPRQEYDELVTKVYLHIT